MNSCRSVSVRRPRESRADIRYVYRPASVGQNRILQEVVSLPQFPFDLLVIDFYRILILEALLDAVGSGHVRILHVQAPADAAQHAGQRLHEIDVPQARFLDIVQNPHHVIESRDGQPVLHLHCPGYAPQCGPAGIEGKIIRHLTWVKSLLYGHNVRQQHGIDVLD